MTAFVWGCLVCTLAASPIDAPAWRLPEDATVTASDALADELIAYAEQADEPLAAFDRRLAAANWLLGPQLAAPATRWLLDAASDADRARVVQSVVTADAQLEIAASLWAERIEQSSLSAGSRWDRQEALDGLRTFVQAFSSLWSPGDKETDAAQETMSAATVGLAILLEHERTDVAEAARLWQAALCVRRGDWQRVLDLSPPALAKPADDSVYGFYLRLLRCRTAPRVVGGYPASVALLARMEARATEWFTRPEHVKRAQATAALMRRRLLTAWADTHLAADERTSAARCEYAIQRIDQVHFAGDDPVEVLALPSAVPNLVDIAGVVAALHAPPTTAPADAEDADTNGEAPSTPPPDAGE